MEVLVALSMGIGLSAACGFRVFVPLLATSLLAISGQVRLADGLAWMGSTPALVVFGSATLLEISAYYLPWLDNALDTLATPAALVAGTLITSSLLSEVSPWVRWPLALIAGTLPAAFLQGSTALLRAKSSAFTGGLGNAFVATGEWVGALLLSTLAALLPVFTALALLALGLWLLVGLRQRFRAHPRSGSFRQGG